MNRTELVDELVYLGEDPADARKAVDMVLNAICRHLACGETVTLRNFGKFEPRARRAVVRRNPKTGAPVEVPAKTGVGFVAAPKLKERMNPALQAGVM